jgi:hypothetical protein
MDIWRVGGVGLSYEKKDAYICHRSLSRHGGRFRDEDLARILQNATAASASAFKARGTPEVLRVVEILGIKQGRAWGACTVRMLRLMPHLCLSWNSSLCLS